MADLQAEADDANNGRYRLHHWTDRCPDRWLEAVAVLENQAGADVDPALEASLWSRTWCSTAASSAKPKTSPLRRAGGRWSPPSSTSPSGTLVGLTTITVLAHRADVVFQDDTLVLQEHRGNKLGLLIKVANMERLTEQFPDARVIYTWNAPENRYLLTVNQQLGFRTAGVTGIWQKELPKLAYQHQLSRPIWRPATGSRRLGGPKTVGCWKSTLSSIAQLCSCARGIEVGFRTKDPHIGRPAQVNEANAPRNHPR